VTHEECLAILKEFARRVRRFGETSDAGMFASASGAGEGPMRDDELNVQLCVKGRFGLADDFYRAIRFLRAQT
jgi:hypothetical protein